MNMKIAEHTPVMTDEVIAGLNIKADGIYIDATFGRGGHTQAILAKLGNNGRILAIDKDPEAIRLAKQLQQQDPRVRCYHGSYAEILKFCQAENVVGKINGIVLDLGVSSPQLAQAARGFSFLLDGPLDMRMDPTTGIAAATWLAQAQEDEIAKVLKLYGEEKYAKLLAKAISKTRQTTPITTTKILADLISKVYPNKGKLKKHPATKSFQGIRIFINNELQDLRELLSKIIQILAPAGRLVVISFHSLEDKIVKQFINKQAQVSDIPHKLPMLAQQIPQPILKKISKSRPQQTEVSQNVRARSAMLRVAEKLVINNLAMLSPEVG